MSLVLLIVLVLVVAAVVAALYFYNARPPTTGGAAEVEARFLNVDPEELRKKLRDLGGDQVYARRKFRRKIYALHGKPGFARVRDEGDAVTMTVKTYENPKYPEEKELIVKAPFDAACEFLNTLLNYKAYQETYREKWTLPGCNEIVIDNIPGFLPYCEIECDTEDQLKAAADKLGFKWENAHFGAYGTTFEEFYGISRKFINEELSVLKFETVEAELSAKVVKNREYFDRAIKYARETGL